MWITCLPLAWLVSATFTAAWQKIFSPLPRLGFLAQAAQLEASIASGQLSPARAAEAGTLIFNARLDAVVCGIFLALVAVVVLDSVRLWVGILRGVRKAETMETPFVASRLRAEEL
jgi:carbon starvation protein